MKRNLFTTVLFCIITTSLLSQTQPENPGFELWEDVGLSTDEPVEWSSIKTSDNGTLNGFAPYVWDQSTDAHTGAYSVKLFNASVLGIVAAGTMTNGRVHADLNPDNGYVFTDVSNSQWQTPCTEKPDSVVVWVKYFPQGGDVGQVTAVLHTGTAKIPDATMNNWIAQAQINIPGTLSTWTRFSAPFNYMNGNTPEYILFVLNSAGVSATNGSNAYFDDLELIYNPVILDLTVFIQGPYVPDNLMSTNLNPADLPLNQPYNIAPWNYNGTEQVSSIPNGDVVDWVLVEIRDAASASGATNFTSKGRKAGFLLSDGSIVGTDGTTRLSFDYVVNQNLFVVVWHRNHLGIMSAYPLAKTDGIYTYNFSDASDKIYGGLTGSVQLKISEPGVWGMAGGDGDANGLVEMADKTSFWSILTGKSGYLSSDYTLDGQTNNPDKNKIWLKNLGKDCQVPD